jgi:hypothetical protein
MKNNGVLENKTRTARELASPERFRGCAVRAHKASATNDNNWAKTALNLGIWNFIEICYLAFGISPVMRRKTMDRSGISDLLPSLHYSSTPILHSQISGKIVWNCSFTPKKPLYSNLFKIVQNC